MKHHDWMRREEQAFLENYAGYAGQQNYRALKEIHKRIGLDFFGVDCWFLPNGKLLVFEANPAMGIRLLEARARVNFRYKLK